MDWQGMEPALEEADLAAKIEPFDTFWEAPEDIEKGYQSFGQFYRANYLAHLPKDRDAKVLVISCGPGYFVHLLGQEGYRNILGIDSDPEKVAVTAKRGLNCRAEHAFTFLHQSQDDFDLIFVEQEINHLTKDEIKVFLGLCRENLRQGGCLVVHCLNGANPITGSEALAQNFDHYNTFTEYSLRQVLSYTGFREIRVIPLKLYVFYSNPLNLVGMVTTSLLELFFRITFKLYGKSNRIFTKKIAAISVK